MALCTLVGLEGSFSRRIGAQIAVGQDGRTIGSLSDGCLEHQLAADAAAMRASGAAPAVMRYGRGSEQIDFRLPCGSGLDILIDPRPDRQRLKATTSRLADRQEAILDLPVPSRFDKPLLRQRIYMPPIRLLLFGEGREFAACRAITSSIGICVEGYSSTGEGGTRLALGQIPSGLQSDAWTAILLLFHDHEWERELLRWALAKPAFFIGAQGGAIARQARRDALQAMGIGAQDIARLRSPVGLIERARDPEVLALSVLAEIVGCYEHLHER